MSRRALLAALAMLTSSCSSSPAPRAAPSDAAGVDVSDEFAIGIDATPPPDASPIDVTTDDGATDGSSIPGDVAVQTDGSPIDAHVAETGPDPRISDAGCVPGLVWTSTSRSIDLSRGGYYASPIRYRKSRAAMSEAQLTALHQLCLIPPPTQHAYDLVSYRVTVGDDDGTSARYRATVPDIIDDDERLDRNLPTIKMASLKPFVDLLDCPSNPLTSLDPSRTPTLSRDPGCITSVLLLAGCAQISARWRVDEPSTYRFETVPPADQGPPAGCRATTRFKVLTEDGSTELAAGTAAPRPVCASLDYRFDAPGTYLVVIDKTNGAASCDSRDPDDEGLVELRVTRLN